MPVKLAWKGRAFYEKNRMIPNFKAVWRWKRCLETVAEIAGKYQVHPNHNMKMQVSHCISPKYRRQVIYRQIKRDIGKILRQQCDLKKVEILEAEVGPDYIHMLASIPANLSVSQFVGYLKGKSSLMIFDRHANLKYRYGNRLFWCRGCFVDTAGRNEKVIAEYIRNQLLEDLAEEKLSPPDLFEPFTGEDRCRM